MLYAGAPTIRARWAGTGTSYALVDYISVEPDGRGGAAVVDGLWVAVTGRC